MALVYALFILIGLTAIGRIVYLQFFDKEIKTGSYQTRVYREDPLSPIRGSIIARDGRYMAFSTPEYFIGLDCTVAVDSVFEANVGPLAEALANNYKEKSAEEYVKLLRARREDGKGYTKLLRQHVSYNEMKERSKYPLLNLGRRRGVDSQPRRRHERPEGEHPVPVCG